eukprot:761813-Hanusia_phi.AAC.1
MADRNRRSSTSLQGTYLAGLDHIEVQEEIVSVFAEVLKKTRERTTRNRAASEANTKHKETGTLASISYDWAEAWDYAIPSVTSNEPWLGGVICDKEEDSAEGMNSPEIEVVASPTESNCEKNLRTSDKVQPPGIVSRTKEMSFKGHRGDFVQDLPTPNITTSGSAALLSPCKVQYHVQSERANETEGEHPLEKTVSSLYSTFSLLPPVHSDMASLSTPRTEYRASQRKTEVSPRKYDWGSEIARSWSQASDEAEVLTPRSSWPAHEPIRATRYSQRRYFQSGQKLVSRWRSISKLPQDQGIEQILASWSGKLG